MRTIILLCTASYLLLSCTKTALEKDLVLGISSQKKTEILNKLSENSDFKIDTSDAFGVSVVYQEKIGPSTYEIDISLNSGLNIDNEKLLKNSIFIECLSDPIDWSKTNPKLKPLAKLLKKKYNLKDESFVYDYVTEPFKSFFSDEESQVLQKELNWTSNNINYELSKISGHVLVLTMKAVNFEKEYEEIN